MSTQSTSHDPKSDHRSLAILAFFGGGIFIAVLGLSGAFGQGNSAPVKLYTVDGCDLYRFVEDGEKNFFARCANGKVATTDADGKYIVTNP